MIFKFGDMYVSVEDWNPIRKKPVLAVRFEGESSAYKVASFNDEVTAKWFCELLEERAGVKDE